METYRSILSMHSPACGIPLSCLSCITSCCYDNFMSPSSRVTIKAKTGSDIVEQRLEDWTELAWARLSPQVLQAYHHPALWTSSSMSILPQVMAPTTLQILVGRFFSGLDRIATVSIWSRCPTFQGPCQEHCVWS